VVLFRYPGRRQARWPGAVILVAAAALLAAQMAAPGAPARAAVAVATGATWSVQRTPNARVANGSFAAGSCAGPAWCVAVGSTKDSSGTSPLAEAWNGTSWRVTAVPAPPGGTYSALDAVSCTAPTACTAVGRYTSNQNIRLTLAERWNGTAWSVQRTPNPAAPPSASPDPTPPRALLAPTPPPRPMRPWTASPARRPPPAPPSATT
jgi:hypothetical protein